MAGSTHRPNPERQAQSSGAAGDSTGSFDVAFPSDTNGQSPTSHAQPPSGDSDSSHPAVPEEGLVVEIPSQISRSDSSQPASPVPNDDQATVISQRPLEKGSSFAGTGTPLEMGVTLQGRMLDHFELERFVGGGGMGAVFRARDTHLDRVVAVKVLSGRQGGDDEMVKRFRNEAQSAARLDHENIARVYYVGEDDGWYFIVFEFIDGTNIRDLVDQRGPLSADAAVSYTLQVAEALDHAYHRDVVHRDIKPSNILVTAEGHAKLVDMGLARLHQVESPDNDLTASGVTLGTFDYISPEQARDPRSADVRSDIYSLGCTIYYMLTGQTLFSEGTVLQKLLSHSSEAPPDPRVLRPDLPEEIATITARMLSKRPEDRYQDPSELIGDLLLIADRQGLDLGGRSGTIWLSPSNASLPAWQRHLPWMIPLMVLVLAAWVVDRAWNRQALSVDDMPAFHVPATQPIDALPEDGVVSPSPPDRPPRAPDHQSPEREGEPEGAEQGWPRLFPWGLRPGHFESPPSELQEESESNTSWQTSSLFQDAPWAANASALAASGSVAAFPNAALTLAPWSIWSTHGGRGDGSLSPEMIQPDELPETEHPEVPVHTLLVSPDRTLPVAPGEQLVSSLAEAMRLAEQAGDLHTVLLHYDGNQFEPPLRWDAPHTEATLTIKAAPDRHPIVTADLTQADMLGSSRSFLSIKGGQLTIEGVRFELDLSDEMADRWSLLRLDHAVGLRLTGCELLIRNARQGRYPRHSQVAFLQIESGDRDLTPPISMEELPANQVELELRDCILRGEASLITLEQAVPLSLNWTNGLLSTTEALLRLGGATHYPEHGEHIRANLVHLTAAIDQGLCHASTNDYGPYPLLQDIRCESCIFITRSPAPFIQQSGYHTVDELEQLLLYSGERNFYEGVETFWQLNAQVDDSYVDLDFHQWREHWGTTSERRPRWNSVQWETPFDPSAIAHQQTPADFRLRDVPGNPARQSNPDRSDAGFIESRLPQWEESPEMAPQAVSYLGN